MRPASPAPYEQAVHRAFKKSSDTVQVKAHRRKRRKAGAKKGVAVVPSAPSNARVSSANNQQGPKVNAPEGATFAKRSKK